MAWLFHHWFLLHHLLPPCLICFLHTGWLALCFHFSASPSPANSVVPPTPRDDEWRAATRARTTKTNVLGFCGWAWCHLKQRPPCSMYVDESGSCSTWKFGWRDPRFTFLLDRLRLFQQFSLLGASFSWRASGWHQQERQPASRSCWFDRWRL